MKDLVETIPDKESIRLDQINNKDKVFYNIDGKLTLFIIEDAC